MQPEYCIIECILKMFIFGSPFLVSNKDGIT